MTQKQQLSSSTWTEKHDEFCLQNRIPPAAKLLWRWLMEQGNVGEEAEPDLLEFNDWVKKHRGKGYDKQYLKKMLDVLISHGLVQVIKKFCWKIYRLIIRPLEWLKPRKNKNSQNQVSSPNLPPSNGSKAVDEVNQQQQSSVQENLTTLNDAGIHFDESETEVLERPASEIKLALIIFKLRGGFDKIDNPEGWIRQCLRRRYWEHPRNYAAIIRYILNLSANDSVPALDIESILT